MTITICGRDERSGALGVAICSSSPAVAGRCVDVRGAVGSVSAQNLTNPALHRDVLTRLEQGAEASGALDSVMGVEPHANHRQVLVVDSAGGSAVFSGEACLSAAADACERGVAVAGNLLRSDAVPREMVRAFREERAQGLEERLLRALEAGLEAGGEKSPVRSAGLMVADQYAWATTNLRVDWADSPVPELRLLWEKWRPEKDAYVMRAIDPTAAPDYS